jgi:DNA-binding NarL/FixJ family response regulator
VTVDYAAVLVANYPNTRWILNGETYDGLEWLDGTPKPTQAELDAAWPEVQSEAEAQAQAKVAARQSALSKLAALGLTDAEIAALIGA